MTAPTSIAVVGCGAAAEHLHLPALTLTPQWRLAALVDPNGDRVADLASRFGSPPVLASHRDLSGVDAAVVAVPNHLHAEVCTDLLRAGIDVLVEKPAATSSADCREMAAAAARHDRVLAVGMVLRFSRPYAAVETILKRQLLGGIEHVDVRSGVDFSWPLASGYLLDPRAAGGGVLIDLGAHVLDLLVAWFGDVTVDEYRDDAFGGVEADCELRFHVGDGVPGVMELSRTRNLRQTAIIAGDRMSVEVGLAGNALRMLLPDGTVVGGGVELDGVVDGDDLVELVARELADFHAAVTARTSPRVTAGEAARSLAAIEACYRQRQPLELPWLVAATGGS